MLIQNVAAGSSTDLSKQSIPTFTASCRSPFFPSLPQTVMSALDLFSCSRAASMPFFALSWTLTLLSHDLDSVAVLARLFDFLLAHNPSMICHLVVAVRALASDLSARLARFVADVRSISQILLTKKDDLLAVFETYEGDPAIVHSALSQLPTIVLSPVCTEGRSSEPDIARSPSLSPNEGSHDLPSKATVLAEEDEYTEDFMSSASFVESSSDLARSPTLTASSSVSTFAAITDSEDDMDASVITPSEIEIGGSETIAGLRRRRRPVSQAAAAQSVHASAMSSSLLGYEADNDRGFEDDLDSLHALDESMFSDPDIEGLAFQPFPTSASSSRATAPTTPPRDCRQTSRSGNVIVSASSPPDSPSHLPPRRTVVIDELIQQALELSRQYPVTSLPAPVNDDLCGSPAETANGANAGASARIAAEVGIGARTALNFRADRVLGPNSCVHTWTRSLDGTLTDEAAEAIVRTGEGIVFLDALGPDSDKTETVGGHDPEETSSSSSSLASLLSDDDELGDADADEYDFVSSAAAVDEDVDATRGSSRRHRPRRRRRHRRSSSEHRGRLPPLLALGPHGWLVVSGVAVAAVAYGVYRQQGGAATSAGGHGLGTAGLGLGLGFAGFGGAAGAADGAAAAGAGVAVPAGGVREAAGCVAGTAGAATVLGAGRRLV